MDGLKPQTKYYVRAFAKNSAGVAYGNVVSFTTPALVIGGNIDGGVVFDIDTTGLHGLVCAPADQGEASWSNGSYITTNAGATQNGYFNTGVIYNAEGVTGTYAALICVNYGDWDWYTGYEWYLPSKDELNMLYNEKDAVGGLSGGEYWSSTEADSTNAWLQDFSSGKQTTSDKAVAHHVRAIRAF
jgi:hypothetical protein